MLRGDEVVPICSWYAHYRLWLIPVLCCCLACLTCSRGLSEREVLWRTARVSRSLWLYQSERLRKGQGHMDCWWRLDLAEPWAMEGRWSCRTRIFPTLSTLCGWRSDKTIYTWRVCQLLEAGAKYFRVPSDSVAHKCGFSFEPEWRPMMVVIFLLTSTPSYSWYKSGLFIFHWFWLINRTINKGNQ